MKCCFCKKPITKKQIESGKTNLLMGVYSHRKCDEDKLEQIDKKIKHHY